MRLKLLKKQTFLFLFSTLLAWMSIIFIPIAHAATVASPSLPVVDYNVPWAKVVTYTTHLNASQCAAFHLEKAKPACIITETDKTSRPYDSHYAKVMPPSTTNTQGRPYVVVGGGGGGACPSGTYNTSKGYTNSSFGATLYVTWYFPGDCTSPTLNENCSRNIYADYGYEYVSTTGCSSYRINTGMPYPDIQAEGDYEFSYHNSSFNNPVSTYFTAWTTIRADTYTNGLFYYGRGCNNSADC